MASHMANMKAQAHGTKYLPLLIAGFAVILLSATGVSAVMAWTGAVFPVAKLPAPPSGPVESAMREDGDARVSTKCAECGVVESTREIVQPGAGVDPAAAGAMAGSMVRLYEITVRMKDGSIRVFKDASPTNWRHGERLTFIEGASRSNH